MVTLESLDLQKITSHKLGELLMDAKKAYYAGGKPIMDDHTYDTLEEILQKKDPHHRLFSKIGTSDFNTGFDKKPHVMPMGSQNKVNKYEDLVHYFELKKIPPLLVKGGEGGGFVLQPKCDGISLEIIYQDGQLVQAITRGDGLEGDVITQNVVKMKNFVASLPKGLSCSVRCEIMVTKNDFKKLNEVVKKNVLPPLSRGGDPTEVGSEGFYSNPRNAASGLSQRLDGLYSEYCSLYAVDILTSLPQKKEIDKYNILKSLGFTPVETTICHSPTEIETIYQKFLNQDRLDYPYEIDGLVVKINDLSIQKELGSKNGRPKGQVAYKFPASTNTTTIESISWATGPLGTVTPVAKVEPIELSGAIVTYASLGNFSLIKEKNLNVGDIVKISRRGDVIPHIENVITKVTTGHIDIPQYCPSCQTTLISEDKFLRCPNTTGCLAQILGSLRLFCDTLGILGLSDKTISKLYQANRIRLPGDFYKLTPDDILDLENLGEKSAKNIVNQIQSKKNLTLKQVFDAAIIPNFSNQRIQQLINSGFDTPQNLLNISVTQLESLPGFQKTLAQKVWQGIQVRRPWIESILNNVSIAISRQRSNVLNDLSFCITGDLSQPRPKITELIESLGGKIQSTVSKNTSYLLTNLPAGRHGESASNSSKFTTAKKLNIPIINEDQLNQLIQSS